MDRDKLITLVSGKGEKLEPYIITTVDSTKVKFKPSYMSLAAFKRTMAIKYGKCKVTKATKVKLVGEGKL